MIPKTIHYCWFGGKQLPVDAKKCILSWKKFCPDYTISRWDESNFDVHCHPFAEAAYEAGAWAFVSDFARLKIIYENGGIYLDTDIELIKSLDSVISADCYFAAQAEPHLIATGLGFGASAHHPLVGKMMYQYDSLVFSAQEKEKFLCPKLNTDALRECGYQYTDEIQHIHGATIYPARFFDPINSIGFMLTKDTISIHHYSASWESGKHRLKRKIAWFIGPQLEGKLKSLFKKS